MDLRQYDVAIARWIAIDPITHHSQSTYAAFDNNPVFWADPSGAATGFAGAVEQHANGLGASEMGMDNEKWEHEEGDTYRNNSTGETTNDWGSAVGETEASTTSKLEALYNDMVGYLFNHAWYSGEYAAISELGHKKSDGTRIDNTFTKSKVFKLNTDIYAKPESEGTKGAFYGNYDYGHMTVHLSYVAGTEFASFKDGQAGSGSWSGSNDVRRIDFYRNSDETGYSASLIFPNQITEYVWIQNNFYTIMNISKQANLRAYENGPKPRTEKIKM